jgi:dTDP-4-amino-4,6-dideoxygalactose transaminase
MLRRIRNWLKYFYSVPWCVPAWGYREFLTTLKCLVRRRITEGSSPPEAANLLKEHLGCSFILPVNRGRAAIELALRAMQATPSDDVVLPSYVCQSVLDAVRNSGANPIFADIGHELNLTVDSVTAALTPKTKCVIVPHLFGKAAPIDEIEKVLDSMGIALIDDAAQSFGARRAGRLVGTFGSCGIVSCGPGKSLAGPAGGFLVTNSRELYQRAAAIPLGSEATWVVAKRMLSFWLWRRFRKFTLPLRLFLDMTLGEESEEPHVNARMSNLDAAIVLEQIRSLESNTRKRRSNAEVLLSALGDASRYVVPNTSAEDVALKLIVVFPEDGPRAEEAVSYLRSAKIECQVGYGPLHLRSDAGRTVSLPFAEVSWDRVLCLPVECRLKPGKPVALLARSFRELSSTKDEKQETPRDPLRQAMIQMSDHEQT